MEHKAFIAALNLIIAVCAARAAYLYGKFAYQRRAQLKELGFSYLPLAIWWVCSALTLEGLFYGMARVLRRFHGINLWDHFDLVLPLRAFTLVSIVFLVMAYWRAAHSDCGRCLLIEMAAGVGAFGVLTAWLY